MDSDYFEEDVPCKRLGTCHAKLEPAVKIAGVVVKKECMSVDSNYDELCLSTGRN